MKAYRELTDTELLNELENLRTGLEQDIEMDGSGELSGIIYEGYERFFNAVYEEMDARGLCEDEEAYYAEVPF